MSPRAQPVFSRTHHPLRPRNREVFVCGTILRSLSSAPTGSSASCRRISLHIGVVALAGGVGTAADGPMIVHGQDVLRSARDALTASAAESFRSGRMKFRSEYSDRNIVAGTSEATDEAVSSVAGTVLWSPRGTRWEYALAQGGASVEGAGGQTVESAGILIYDGERLLRRHGNVVFVLPISNDRRLAAEIAPVLRVRPSDVWFDDLRGRSWASWIDPDDPHNTAERLGAEIDGTVAEIAVGFRSGFEVRLQVELSDPARILSVRSSGAETSLYRTDITWADQEGGGYPRKFLCREESVFPSRLHGGFKRSVRQLQFSASDYDTSPASPSDAFTLQGMNLPTGARIIYQDALGKNLREEWVGGRPATAEDRLDSLADRLSRGTFAGGAGEDK